MTPLAPLLAWNLGDLVWVAAAILFVVVPAIGRLLAKMAQQQRPGGRPPVGRPQAGPGPAPGRGLEDEIGEFLRRAAQQRQAGAQPAGEQPVEAQLVARPPTGEEIQQHVGQHLDTAEFRRRAAELGGEVAQADEQVEQRLHAKFDHEVSSLATRPGESVGAPQPQRPGEPEDRPAQFPSTAAVGVAAMLTNAQSIRQAIVINEILTRPEDRWT